MKSGTAVIGPSRVDRPAAPHLTSSAYEAAEQSRRRNPHTGGRVNIGTPPATNLRHRGPCAMPVLPPLLGRDRRVHWEASLLYLIPRMRANLAKTFHRAPLRACCLSQARPIVLRKTALPEILPLLSDSPRIIVPQECRPSRFDLTGVKILNLERASVTSILLSSPLRAGRQQSDRPPR